MSLWRFGEFLYCARMVLRLRDRDFLRLRGARGAAIEVVRGRVWITEDGRSEDRFLNHGDRYRISGDGLVLVEAETGETTVRFLP